MNFLSENQKRFVEWLELNQKLEQLPSYLWEGKKEQPPQAETMVNSSHLQETFMTSHSNQERLEKLRNRIGNCQKCRLHEDRTHLVFGTGNPNARLMFVGEAPGRDEDLQGEPFVGRAGQLLTKIIEAMGLKRSDVYICNIVKSRPPDNRKPASDEIEVCSPFLFEQIEIIRPEVIVCLGSVAGQTLLGTEETITKLRGKLYAWPSEVVQNRFHLNFSAESIKLMATYHPAYLLRNPNMKRPVWEDMKIVMEAIGSTDNNL